MLVRLNKYLANKGYGARRKCDEYIADGKVKINGVVVTQLGTKVETSTDKVELDNAIIDAKENPVYFALNKPVGHVCTVSGPEEPKVTELFADIPERVFPVGRLDKLTGGLLIMTNDGNFSYQMTHPKFEKEKEYVVKVREKVTRAVEEKLAERFYIQGKLTMSARIFVQSPHLFHVILREGRNRQIRRMCERSGLTIEKLKRVRIGKFMLGTLKPGEYKALNKDDLDVLLGERDSSWRDSLNKN